MTTFKDSFKYYKSKNPPPKLENVIDFNQIKDNCSKVEKILIQNENNTMHFGFKPLSSWECFRIHKHPGLIFIKNPYTSLGQRYWIVRCLQDYSKKSNKTNIDSQNLVPENVEWWELCQNNKNRMLLEKLRWVTFGYHHDWDTKVYSEDSKSEFPADLASMTSFIANLFGYSNYNAEAAIVNFYHMDSTLSGHTDHSEENLDAPLFSYSFGQTAIFLLGGKSKEDCPSAMFLRSGDIVIMSKESRLCYHGVPKILQIDSRYWDINDEREHTKIGKEYQPIVKVCKDDTLWKPFGDYLLYSRININVRQVLQRGHKRLKSDSVDDLN